MKLVVQELEVHAPAQVLYELLTDPALFVQWMADDATLDPRPGGVVRWTHAIDSGGITSGVSPQRPRRLSIAPGRRRLQADVGRRG